jgi:hypothetical protein
MVEVIDVDSSNSSLAPDGGVGDPSLADSSISWDGENEWDGNKLVENAPDLSNGEFEMDWSLPGMEDQYCREPPGENPYRYS